jgi:hypothetical protein
MPSLEQRVERLFPGKRGCLIKAAIVFAAWRDEWLTQEDLINFIGKDFANSTIRNAYEELSSPIESLNNNSYIEVTTVKSGSKGRPVIKGRLSEAAQKRIFTLTTPVKCPPSTHYIGLDKIGRIEIPPLSFEKPADKFNKPKIYLSPKDILDIIEQKIGIRETNRSLRRLIKKGQAKEIEVSRTHRWGRSPHHQYRLLSSDLERLAKDTNLKCFSMGVSLRSETEDDRKRLEADGMIQCPSCGNPVNKSDIIRVTGAKIDSCLTEYMQAALNNTIIERQDNGSLRETVKGMPELTATGSTKDQCRENLSCAIIDWVRFRQNQGLKISPPIGG